MRIRVPDSISSRRPDAYLVGGCVRDLIQGVTPRDYDLAVSEAPRNFAEEIATRLGGRFFVLGKDKFTVFCVTTPEAQIDIMAYKGPDIQSDLMQRDFTINALACRLSDGRLVDVAGGLEDLHRRMVRMVSPLAFRDDPVRLVRAFRMGAAMNFRIETETLETIKASAHLLRQSAAERIWAELQRILACPGSYPHLLMMYNTNVLPTILPELVEYHPGLRRHHRGSDDPNRALGAIQTLEAILDHPDAFLPPVPAEFVQSFNDEDRVLLKMAALLRDIGKPECRTVDAAGRIRYYGHAARGAESAQAIGRRLRLSNRHREWLATLVHRHQQPLFLFRAGQGRKKPPPKATGRFFRQCGAQAPHLLTLSLAGSMTGTHPSARHPSALTGFLIGMLAYYADKIDPRRQSTILNGQDLIRNFNLRPSPVIGTILRRVEELYLAGLIRDREQALQWVGEHIGTQQHG